MTDGQRTKATTALDVAMRVGFPILLGVAGWTFTELLDHDGRLIRLETRADARRERVEGLASDVAEIKRDIKKLLEAR